jgi:very-short-patch-repair endonuclease
VSRTTQLRAAQLACGEGAVISHGTAAAFWGLWDRPPALIDVTVPVEAGRKLDGIRCRRCRYPQEEEIVEHQGVICTTPARVLVDLAGMVGLETLRRTVERAAVLKLLDLTAADLSLHFAKRRRGLRGLRTVLADWRTPDGKVQDVRSDFEVLWPERKVVVETAGAATHQTPVAFQRDRHRDQLLIAAGYRVPRVTWDQMKAELDEVVARVAETLTLSDP